MMSSLVVFPFKTEQPGVVLSNIRTAAAHPRVGEVACVGYEVEYLVFDDEGHDMVKHENKVEAYAAILEFFETRLT